MAHHLDEMVSCAEQLLQGVQHHVGCLWQSFKNHSDMRDGDRTRRVVHCLGPRQLLLCSISDNLSVQSRVSKGKKKAAGAQVKSKGRGKEKPPREQERILISEVEILGVEENLQKIARNAMTIRPNFAYTLQEVEDDLQRVFDTGWFTSCVPDATDTRDGVKLLFKITANPAMRGIRCSGGDALPAKVMQDAFKKLQGKTMNFVRFGKAVNKLDRWYKERGILGKVLDYTFKDNVVNLTIGEAEVNQIDLRFVDAKTNEVKEEGAAKTDIITRHFVTRPQRTYSLRQAKQDIDAVYNTGLFEDVSIIPKESEDSKEENPKVHEELI